MKKFSISIAIIVFIFAIKSCDDISNSGANIIKEKVEYEFVKSNQTNDVILPLAVGNTWIFQVEEFNKNGTLKMTYIDSIMVCDEIMLNGELWFKVKYPMGNFGDTVFMTNTNIGLWYKCTNCFEKSALKAQFPVQNDSFIAAYFRSFIFVSDSLGNLTNKEVDVQHIVDVKKNHSVTYNNSSYQAIKYSLGVKINYTPNVPVLGKIDETFIPNLGLYNVKQYYQNGTENYIFKTYNLIDYKLQ